MNQLKDRRRAIGTLCVFILLALVASVVLVRTLTANPPIAVMKLTAENDNHGYCADFVAHKDGENNVKITITNCGNATFVLRTDNDEMGEVLAADGEYETVLQRGSAFSADVETIDGEYLGGFTY